ncbi:MAG: DUF2075 domain-containing protein [Mediterranea massiliensis]|nr:DUF2075 domain-containing protein [Mediterranea massiliensis]
MINNYLEGQIKEFFPYEPTLEQDFALKMLSQFLLSKNNEEVFLLRGYAGTGKTSLVGALVKVLNRLQQKVILLAPTGRAAKVFSAYAGHSAFTIHKKIYRQLSFSNEVTNFSVNENLAKHTLFIVDEASMISNEGVSGTTFGSGRLLDDLIQYVYSGEGCRLLLMGDLAQLPPIGEERSPALFADVLKGYGLNVLEIDLTQVVRQSQQSGILWNATRLRKLISEDCCYSLPKIKISGFPDIQVITGNELIDALEACYDRDGLEETIVICQSNKRANLYNNGIRSRILWRDDELNTGDLLMVAKNNYCWAEKEKELEFIANGELVEVRRVRRERELYGFRFVDVTLAFLEQDGFELEVNLLLDTLQSEAPALTKTESEKLFNAVLEDYADIPLKRDRMKKMKADPYYNALQVKYAYAITCHKAQGGQWKNVFLDQGYLRDEGVYLDYFRWLYTAFTRATSTLYLVNYPQRLIE